MSKSDRLLNLVQALRRHRRPVTAETLALELEVSVRTIYRDIAGLVANRVPIKGEAGIGYVLEAGFDLPPMMFTADEIEAILVGMRWLRGRADVSLAKAAEDVLAKVGEILPKNMQPLLFEGTLFAPNFHQSRPPDQIDVGLVRLAIRKGHKIAIAYNDANGTRSQRTVWPFGLSFFETSRVIMAWCEMRHDFRSFRADRISKIDYLQQPYPARRADLLKRWKASLKLEGASPH